LFVLACVAVAAALGPRISLPDPTDDRAVQIAFKEFMVSFDKQYEGAEMKKRFGIFKSNLVDIHAQNNKPKKVPGSATFGITKFTDMTPDEFQNSVLMHNGKAKKTVTREQALKIRKSSKRDIEAAEGFGKVAPSTFDWRLTSQNPVTAVKNQEQCGSCWAFSATETIESAWIMAGKATATSINLAPQQIVDCAPFPAEGCDGGFAEIAFAYVANAGGLEPENDYPYQGVTGTTCQFNKADVVAKISGYTPATHDYSETLLQQSLVNIAPTSICLDASAWQNYVDGVMTWDQCAWQDELDHCVQLVGYNNTGSLPYWLVRNSWAESWGVDGYIWLQMWEDTCGVAHDANNAVALV